MNKIKERSDRLIQNVNLSFQRDAISKIKWNWRLISLLGARGVGKTTLLLQHAKLTHSNYESVIYISLDDIYFTTHQLLDFADEFYKKMAKSFI